MIQDKAPTFSTWVEKIFEISPLQKKRLIAMLAKRDAVYFERAEEFAVRYGSYLVAQGLSVDEAVRAYLKMCHDMLTSQIKFIKTDRYPVAEATEAYHNVYSNESAMTSYMVGLALSQFLWKTHYEIYSWFRERIARASDRVSSYLEIGPGHGLFLLHALETLAPECGFTAVDISPVSIHIASSVVNALGPKGRALKFIEADVMRFSPGTQFDYVMMGEVLEHVMDPARLLKQVRHLVSDSGGRLFVSTCVNCPSIDHVYRFYTVDDIRSLLRDCGFLILDEKVLPVEDLPMEEIVNRRITINYCAELTRN